MKKIDNKGFALSTLIYGTVILFIMVLFILLASLNSSLRILDDRVNNVNKYETGEIVVIEEGPNKPKPPLGLVPVVYDDKKEMWKITSETDPDWYDYDNQKWANAVILKDKNKINDTSNPYIQVDIDKSRYVSNVCVDTKI